MSYFNLCRAAICIPSLLLLTASFCPAHAQQRVEPWKAPHFSIAPKALFEAATVVAAPENADVAILEDDTTYSFDEAGRSVRTEYVVYKVLTQKGADGWDSVAVDWEPWHQERPRIRARVIGSDLSVHMLDPKRITEAPAREGEYKTYGDAKTLRAPFPAIASGVVVEEEFVVAETAPFFALGNVGRIYFGRTGVPVAHSMAEFDAPASLPLRTDTVLLNDLKPQRSEANGRVKLVYEHGPMDALSPSEPNLPPDVPHFPAVEYSTGASWQAIAVEYGKVVESHANPSSVQTLVNQLIAGKTTAGDKEQAIVEYLDREIRYTGIEFDEAAIIPHDPAETLANRYGDCKDKATLLVTMLRSAGIPAYVALLNAGSRADVPADLPGMGLFDHAIVYVPDTPEMWIDATDPYARLGQLPAADQGRSALIARPETTGLVKTPESTSKDNVLLELRQITLTENGLADVVEISQPTGVFEGEYRDFYADKPGKDTRAGLTEYVKAQYVSDKLTKVDRTNPNDLSRQFELTIACEKAKRGYTGLDSAVAAIRVDSLFQRLPRDLQRKEDTDDKKDNKDTSKKPRTEDWELPVAFTSEWRYTITPPPGFVPKPLPKDTHIELGPAVLTEAFSADNDGSVHARLIFDTVKRRYTVAEATALRNKVAELVNGPAILVNFEPRAEALLREGKVREALASYRSLVALHPQEPVHHLQVAEVLLNAGMGEAAREEAEQAVKLDPTSALAEKTLAEILKRDLVGRNLRAGSDMAGAAEAYRAAIKLDPDDNSTRGDLAILLEYDTVGRRYGRGADLKGAIAEYETLGQDKLTQLGLANNLAFAQFYAGEYAAAYKTAQSLDPQPRALQVASVAMMQGTRAGLAEAGTLASDDGSYKETLRVAGQMLMNMRTYAPAADFLQAGAAGDNAAQTIGLANSLRDAVHHEDIHFANTPQDVARRALLAFIDPNLTESELIGLSSRNLVKLMKNKDSNEIETVLKDVKKLNIELARQGSSMDVTMDMMLHDFDIKSEGNDIIGYRERGSIPGGSNDTYYVVKENGQYKLLGTKSDPDALGLEILDRIKAGNLRGAKALLDWLREDRHMAGGDDPLGGPVFPRFWMKGEAADARRMRLAAAALLADSKPTAAEAIAILEPERRTAATEHERTNIELALATGYSVQQNFQKLYEVASELLKQVPESKLAFMETINALVGIGRYDAAMHVADERLKLLEDDPDAYQAKMNIESSRGDYTQARAWARKLVDMGNGDANLMNSIAWYALFTPAIDPEDIATAIKATQMSRNNPAILHTLACLYAQSGKAKEAHDLLLRGMDELNLVEPDDDYWYAFGLIAEQYGEKEIALADYRKLSKPKYALAIPTSTYKLAEMRIKALEAGTQEASR